ncbi:MAG: CorA family divalent cation transporter [Candidatus Melainabacteria bacterium]|nr:CorA family divalent cation transporter [Candidatus Melainabacteria bacterium]
MTTHKAPRARDYRRAKFGQAPGTPLVHTPMEVEQPFRLHAIRYSEHDSQHHPNIDLASAQALIHTLPATHHLWLDVEGRLPNAFLSWLEQQHISPLTLEDLQNPAQRPKVDHYEHYDYWVATMLRVSRQEDAFREQALREQALCANARKGTSVARQSRLMQSKALPLTLHQEPLHLMILPGQKVLVSIQPYCDGDVLDPVRQRLLNSNRQRFGTMGSWYLAYALLDLLVDHYFVVWGELEETLEDLEAQLEGAPNQKNNLLDVLHQYKYLAGQCRRVITPTQELVNQLLKHECQEVPVALKPYLHDLQDHLMQLKDYVDRLFEAGNGLLDLQISLHNARANKVMQTLTQVSTIFMPITFIASIYGMNFVHMPELKWPWAYPSILGIMALVAASMGVFLYRQNR